jgi:uncharacterized protein (TIGR00730 family)
MPASNARRRSSRTGDPDTDARLDELVSSLGGSANRDQILDMLTTVVRMANDNTDRLDLKIANAALKEMRDGFQLFAPYRERRKITMFGSARTLPSDPLYAQARDLAAVLAAHGWDIITGAGPGIMAAGLEGAGPDHAFGINIRLPFEQGANEFIASDPKLVSMKYFFTRKLLLIKESDAYVVLPGGFGTLDEAFELLTLMQTGKALPAPIVMLEVPGGTYWRAWEEWVSAEVEARNLIGHEDRHLYCITGDVEEARTEILSFYRNYHSLRLVGDTLVIRLRARPTDAEAAALSEEFVDLCTSGGIRVLDEPLPAEARSDDVVDLPRIALQFDRMSYARLHLLIDAINDLPTAPPLPAAIP